MAAFWQQVVSGLAEGGIFGALALALGLVALLNGRWAGAAIAAGGVVLVLWSRRVAR